MHADGKAVRLQNDADAFDDYDDKELIVGQEKEP